MYQRFLELPLQDALQDSPVVLVTGARQTGKTTLVRHMVNISGFAKYVTLDDIAFLSAATSDPTGFISGGSETMIIDEIQRAPQLFPAIKASVDRDRRPGRFILTGSSNIMLLPKLSESLAGRMEILTMWPLAQAEIEGAGAGIVDHLFGPNFVLSGLKATSRPNLLGKILAGGYPEPLERSSESRRRAWFNSYIATILQRDVRDVANIEGLTDLPRLLALLGARVASLLNVADISRSAGMPYTTLHRYLTLLQTTFLIQFLPPWSSNLGSRLVRSPKLLLNDTGLTASLIGLDAERLLSESSLLGPLIENFASMEIVKAIGPSKVQPRAYHYRTVAGAEVDLLLEAANGKLVGIEVKASATVTARDFRGLRALSEATGDAFVRGIVIYTGDQIVPFGERLLALPIQALWSGQSPFQAEEPILPK